MIIDVPAVIPFIIPVDPIVATALVLVAHVPPFVTSLNDVANPEQTLAVPEIAFGRAFTVIIEVALQPVGSK